MPHAVAGSMATLLLFALTAAAVAAQQLETDAGAVSAAGRARWPNTNPRVPQQPQQQQQPFNRPATRNLWRPSGDGSSSGGVGSGNKPTPAPAPAPLSRKWTPSAGSILGCTAITPQWAGRYWSTRRHWKGPGACSSSPGSRSRGYKSCLKRPVCEDCQEPRFTLNTATGMCDCAPGYGMVKPAYVPCPGRYSAQCEKKVMYWPGYPAAAGYVAPLTATPGASSDAAGPGATAAAAAAEAADAAAAADTAGTSAASGDGGDTAGGTVTTAAAAGEVGAAVEANNGPEVWTASAYRAWYKRRGRKGAHTGYFAPGSPWYRPGHYPAGPYCQPCPLGTSSGGGAPLTTFCINSNGTTPSPSPPPPPAGSSVSPPPPPPRPPPPPSPQPPSPSPPFPSPPSPVPSPPPPPEGSGGQVLCPGGASQCPPTAPVCVPGEATDQSQDFCAPCTDTGNATCNLEGFCDTSTGTCIYSCQTPVDCLSNAPNFPVCDDRITTGTCVVCTPPLGTAPCPFGLDCSADGRSCTRATDTCNISQGAAACISNPARPVCVQTNTDGSGVCLPCNENQGIFCLSDAATCNADGTCSG